MAALGTLTAGIAHEINNPIVAVDRGADQLQEKLRTLGELTRKLKAHGVELADSARLDTFFENIFLKSIEAPPISTAEARKLSERLETLFRTHKVLIEPDDYRKLGTIGIDEIQVQPILRLMEKYDPSLIAAMLYIHASIGTIVRNMKISAARIGTIVSALKGFSHLDRAPFKEYSIHDGIESTLVILHNLIKYGITIEKYYSDNLPLIQAYPGELNQVWMNILHNAVQAAGGSGKIRIETFVRDDLVAVKISDNGPGIPDDILPKIFEPFFTTKEQSQGTGLGLNIVYKIIEKHKGQIHVESKLGEGTAFEILLPIKPSIDGGV
jgi:signal transduction histidine kinase